MNREALIAAIVTAILNGGVTYGVVSTKLDWLRVDVDRAHLRIDRIENPKGSTP